MNPTKVLALERDKNKCQRMKDGHICARTERLTMHHLISRRMGGRDDLDNVVIWCWDCHRKYNAEEAHQRKKMHDLRKNCKWTVDWKCKPATTKCDKCGQYYCANWPEGFIEGLYRMLAGLWPTRT